MKKILSLALACIMFVTAFASCAAKDCTSHVDNNGDGKCDNCGKALTTHLPSGDDDDVCTSHVDNDGDGSCDRCGVDMNEAVEPVEPTEFTVSFDTDGAGDIESVVVKKGKKVAMPSTPEKEGCVFLGWYNGDEKYDFDSKVTSDLALVAKWREKSTTEYEDFTLYGDQLIDGLGYEGFSNISGGNLENVSDGKVESFKGKDNVLTFYATAHYIDYGDGKGDQKQNYSGGGIYIDLADYVPNGKIDASQKFTITVTLYQSQAQGYRFGFAWGDGEKDKTWYNLWKNAYDGKPGWKTIVVTSDELHNMADDEDNLYADKDVTGIYIGLHNSATLAAIADFTITFDK